MKQNPKRKGRTDISDLNEDSIVRFQHKHYILFAPLFGIALPALVAGLGWGDWRGGVVYAGILRYISFVYIVGTNQDANGVVA